MTAAEARTFADQSVAALVDVVKTGWAFPSTLKELDFDALRGRPDFQTLIMDLEAKPAKPPEVAPPPRAKK